MRLRSRIIEFFSRKRSFDKALQIFPNGEDNAYASTLNKAIEESVTASIVSDIRANFISGEGFGVDLNKAVVHKEKRTTAFQLLQDIAESTSRNHGFYMHINYDGNFDIKNLDVLPFDHCKVGKDDDNEYSGKIGVCSDWEDATIAKKAKFIDVYNPDKQVIAYQIEQAGGIDKYKGQILYFKYGKYIYPLSPFHSVRLDMESERQASVFKNTSLKQGFFGKTLAITRPLVDDTLRDHEDTQIEWNRQKSERDKFKNTLQQFVGVANSGGLMLIELDFESDKIEDEFLLKNIDTNIDDKLFKFTEESVASNICAAGGVPEILVRQKEGALFGSSGEFILQAKRQVQENTHHYRQNIESILNKVLVSFDSKFEDAEIIPLIAEEVEEVKQREEIEDENNDN